MPSSNGHVNGTSGLSSHRAEGAGSPGDPVTCHRYIHAPPLVTCVALKKGPQWLAKRRKSSSLAGRRICSADDEESAQSMANSLTIWSETWRRLEDWDRHMDVHMENKYMIWELWNEVLIPASKHPTWERHPQPSRQNDSVSWQELGFISSLSRTGLGSRMEWQKERPCLGPRAWGFTYQGRSSCCLLLCMFNFLAFVTMLEWR